MGEGIVENNPVVGTNKAIDEHPRQRVLTDMELASIWAAGRDDELRTSGHRRTHRIAGARGDLLVVVEQGAVDIAGDERRLFHCCVIEDCPPS